MAGDGRVRRAQLRIALTGRHVAICAEADTAAEAVDQAVETQPDVCLLEVDIQGSGIVAAAEIRRRCPASRIVLLTDVLKADEFLNAVRAGVSGYLQKDIGSSRLAKVLHLVATGEVALPRALVGALVDEFAGSRTPPRASGFRAAGIQLTSREWEVAELLGRGLSTRAIAEQLHVAPVTVRTHVHVILRKLQVGSREEAVRRMGEGIC